MPEPSTELVPIIISPDEEHEWDQRDGETDDQYARFQTYLLMPREDRSVLGAHTLWTQRHPHDGPQVKTVQRAHTQFKELSSTQQWRDRAHAYDKLVDAKVMERLANRQLHALVEMADLGQSLRRAAATALKSLSLITREEGTDPETGLPVILIKSKLSATDIAKLAQVGTELEQLAIGAPTDRISLVGSKQGDTTAEQMTSAKTELLRRIEAIRKRRDVANTEEAEVISTGEITYSGEDYRVDDFEVIIGEDMPEPPYEHASDVSDDGPYEPFDSE